MASPIPATARAGSTTWKPTIGVLPLSVKVPPNRKNNETIPETIHNTSVSGSILGPNWGASGSPEAPDTKTYKKTRKVRNCRPTGTQH